METMNTDTPVIQRTSMWRHAVSPEQQRIAIAKACGWLQSRTCNWGGWWYLKKGKRAYQQTPPDYLNDLNAMHEAEKMLNRESGYHEIGGYGLYLVALEHNVSSTAAQRAEAFLKTLNLWKP
jgi:hypothetical protein